jgi:CRISPR locus-related DNA-binding protein
VKSYFVTLGFNETFLLRLLNETSAQRGDNLTVVVPSPVSSGTRMAFENLRVQAGRLYGVEPQLVEVAVPGEFAEVFPKFVDLILPMGEPVITDLTVGMRSFDVFILLSLLVSGKDFQVYVRDENGGWVMGFGRREVRALLRDYSAEEIRLLLEVEKGKTSLEELARVLGKAGKTVQNKVSELKKFSLLHQAGKDRAVTLTPLGKAVIRLRVGTQRGDRDT